MNPEPIDSIVSFATLFAFEGVLSRMSKYMRSQVSFGNEAFLAPLFIALEGPYPFMRSQMSLKVTSFLELFEASSKRTK